MKKFIKKLSFNLVLSAFNSLYRNYFQVRRARFGYIAKNARVRFPMLIKGIENVFLYERTHILGHSMLIATHAKFIMKKNSASAEGLTVITGSHPFVVGEVFLDKAALDVQEAKDVIIEEDVWIAANVTLLTGVVIGRGAVLGSGAVCRNSIPPYAIVVGNPAKIVGFKFSPHEIIEHEKVLYPEQERLPLELLEKNYKKFFLDRIPMIKSYLAN